jgi:osmoprotectant transport system ATP-binding protein
VARFVGADRGLKRLALRRLGEIELESPNGYPADAPRTSLQTTLRDALSLMLTEGAERLVVVDDEGAVAGVLSVGRVSRLLAER